jgi:hypothetical protein
LLRGILLILVASLQVKEIDWKGGEIIDGIVIGKDTLLLSIYKSEGEERGLASLIIWNYGDTSLRVIEQVETHGEKIVNLHMESAKKTIAYQIGPRINLYLESGKKIENIEIGMLSLLSSLLPDAREIIYISPVVWEALTEIYLLDIQTLNKKRITNMESSGNQRVIKAEFGTDCIYLIQGFAYGTVSHGGNLYKISIDSGEKILLKKCEKRCEFRDFEVIGEDSVLLYGVMWDDNTINIQPFISFYSPKEYEILLISPLYFPNRWNICEWSAVKKGESCYILTPIEDGIWKIYVFEGMGVEVLYEFKEPGIYRFFKNQNESSGWIFHNLEGRSRLIRFEEG